MRRARRLSAGLAIGLCALLVVSGTDAVAAPDPTVPSGSAAPAEPDPGPDVLILHTDSSADATSDALHQTLDRLGATVRHVFGRQQAVSVQLPGGASGAAVTDRIAALPGVAQVEKSVTRTLASVPDDPELPGQRAYLNAVAAPAAWDRQRGSSAVRIAVIDTGIDVGHPDLAGKVVGTYNAVTGTSSITDTAGHGTFVAGVAAADTDNRIGVAGAGYDTSILGVKIDDDGDIEIDDEVAGIRWAADHGAKIINLSISGPDASSAELRAVQYAQSKGVLVVAAAGNDGNTVKQYPAAYPGVVAVGATDVGSRRRASFSSYGPWVTLAAPGVSIVSTAPRAGSDYFLSRSGYARGDGTSFSAPLVAGAAALLEAQNPALTASQVRAALVASAHGYAGQGVGRGQIDFDLALQHTAPKDPPVLPLALGTSGAIGFSALSGSPRVAFRVDDDPLLASVPVSGGSASARWSSYGFANGTHTLTAVACSAFGECAASGPSTVFLVANAAPTLTAPAAGDTLSGAFTATADGPDGGGVRVLVDGHEAAFDAAAPYASTVNASRWADGTHTLQVQSCTAARSRCAGPVSAATSVVFDSLHPAITGIDRTRVSPNGDRSGDTAVVTFTLPERQDVTVETVDAAGTVRRRDVLGALAAGRHTTIWRGVDTAGRRLPDGTYQLTLVTSRTVDGVTRRGLTGRAVTVDTVAPRLRGLQGANTVFFPVRDGYRDTFVPTAALPDGGRLVLTIRTTSGATVRTLATNHGPTSRLGLAWNGRNSRGAVVRAGAYRWSFAVSDAAGNVRRSSLYAVSVSGKRLQRRSSTVLLTGAARTDKGGTATCARPAGSSYRRGLHLVNRCRSGSDEVSYARFSFRLPTAFRYDRLQLSAYGRTARTSEVGATLVRTDGGLEAPAAVRVKATRGRWTTISNFAAAAHVSRRTVQLTLTLSSRYKGTNDFDVRTVRLKVTRTVLA